MNLYLSFYGSLALVGVLIAANLIQMANHAVSNFHTRQRRIPDPAESSLAAYDPQFHDLDGLAVVTEYPLSDVPALESPLPAPAVSAPAPVNA